MTRNDRRLRVKRVQRLNKDTNEPEDFITIRRGPHFIQVAFKEARPLVDKVHDICDARDTELRKESP